MRSAMMNSVSQLIEKNEKAFLILIEIGAFGFRKQIEKHPDRIKNIGIFEPGTISVAAGMGLAGLIPTIYGISPFIVQRSLEQLKLDFAYQSVGGNFISTGASYDFSTLGYSHYCPEDVLTLKTLPGFEIITPGTPEQFSKLFEQCAENGRPTYFRMTDYCNKTAVNAEFGKAAVVRKGSDATVVVFAEMLDPVLEACSDLNVNILYYSTVCPFDIRTLQENLTGDKLILCHPFYEGTFADDIINIVSQGVALCEISVPRIILRNYGTKTEKDIHLGLDPASIKTKIKKFLEE